MCRFAGGVGGVMLANGRVYSFTASLTSYHEGRNAAVSADAKGHVEYWNCDHDQGDYGTPKGTIRCGRLGEPT